MFSVGEGACSSVLALASLGVVVLAELSYRIWNSSSPFVLLKFVTMGLTPETLATTGIDGTFDGRGSRVRVRVLEESVPDWARSSC